MTTIRKDVIIAWKKFQANNHKIRELIKENKQLERKLSLHFRARHAIRTMKKGKDI
jgi:hypothetical protein